MQSQDLVKTYTTVNLMDFKEDNWRRLISGLDKLAGLCGSLSDAQREFLKNMRNHMGEEASDGEYDFSEIDKIPLEMQELVLKIYMEFLYLEKEDDIFLQTYSDVLDWFSVSPRRRRAILTDIHGICDKQGASAIAEQYAQMPMIITDTLVIGSSETVKWDKQYVRLDADILCQGVLEASDCVIVYRFDSMRVTQISLSGESAGLRFQNCLFRQDSANDLLQKYIMSDPNKNGLGMGSYESMVTGGAFIQTDSYRGFSVSRPTIIPIAFDSCTFYNCSFFLRGEGVEAEMKHSVLINPGAGFLACSRDSSLLMEDCQFKYTDLKEHSWQNFVTAFSFGHESVPGVLKNCSFTADYEFVSEYESDEAVPVFEGNFAFGSCVMTDLVLDEQMIFAKDADEIKDCVFTDCSDLKLSAKDITACEFRDCSLTLIHSTNETSVRNCRFNHCRYDAEEYDYGNGLIELGPLPSFKKNEVSSCEFTDIEIINGYIISSYSPKKRRSLPAVLQFNVYTRCGTDNMHHELILAEADD